MSATPLPRAHPEVDPAVTGYEPPGGIAAVTAGEVDLALTHTYEQAVADPPAPGVTVEPLLFEEWSWRRSPWCTAATGRPPRPAALLAVLRSGIGRVAAPCAAGSPNRAVSLGMAPPRAARSRPSCRPPPSARP